MKFPQWLCRHDRISIRRAHIESPAGKEALEIGAFVDVVNCVVYARCICCGKILSTSTPEHFMCCPKRTELS